MASTRTSLTAAGVVAAAAIAVQAVVGATSKAADSAAAISVELPSGRWELTAGTFGGESIPLGHGNHPPMIRIEQKRVSGWGPCNGFSGPVMAGPSGLHLGPFMATDMGCRGVAGDVEHAYLAGLRDVITVQSSKEELLLTGPSVRLEFEPYPEFPLADVVGVRWSADAVIDDHGETPLLGTESALFELTRSHDYEQAVGCSREAGTYQLEDGLLLRDTRARGACSTRNLSATERRVHRALSNFYKVTVDADRLILWSWQYGRVRFVAE